MRHLIVLVIVGVFLWQCGCSEDTIVEPKEEAPQPWQRLSFDTTALIATIMYDADSSNLIVGSSKGVFVSTDDGDSWEARNTGLTDVNVVDVAVSLSGTRWIVATAQGKIFVSTDLGVSWQTGTVPLNGLTITCLAAGTDQAQVFAGTWGRGVLRSLDGGLNWQAVGTGLETPYLWSLGIVGGGSVLAGTFNGVCKSTDNGESWAASTDPASCREFNAFVVDAGRSVVYGGTIGCGVYSSADGGNSWMLLSPMSSQDIAMSPGGTTLYLGTMSGVYASSDRGVTWEPCDRASLQEPVKRVACRAGKRLLFAGTSRGMYRIRR